MVKNESIILKILFKTINEKHTITSLSQETKLSRVGIWKIIKKLEKNKLVSLSSIGKGKTSIYEIKLNWENPILEKTLSLILTEEAIQTPRWMENFKELENKTSFLILYGSILHYPKEAKDIDLIATTEENNFTKVDEIINQIQKTQIKKIHFLNFTKEELKKEIIKSNKAFIDGIKKGIILFGQENFIKFIRDLENDKKH